MLTRRQFLEIEMGINERALFECNHCDKFHASEYERKALAFATGAITKAIHSKPSMTILLSEERVFPSNPIEHN